MLRIISRKKENNRRKQRKRKRDTEKYTEDESEENMKIKSSGSVLFTGVIFLSLILSVIVYIQAEILL